MYTCHLSSSTDTEASQWPSLGTKLGPFSEHLQVSADQHSPKAKEHGSGMNCGSIERRNWACEWMGYICSTTLLLVLKESKEEQEVLIVQLSISTCHRIFIGANGREFYLRVWSTFSDLRRDISVLRVCVCVCVHACALCWSQGPGFWTSLLRLKLQEHDRKLCLLLLQSNLKRGLPLWLPTDHQRLEPLLL